MRSNCWRTSREMVIVRFRTLLRQESRERTTNSLRSFIAQDNHCAVGHMRKGQRPFRVKKKKIDEDYSEVLREGTDDLTSRAEEVDTFTACINVDHTGENVGCPPARLLPSNF